MTSRYAEKHAHRAPPCAVPDCLAPGAKLARRGDEVAWWCVDHAAQDDPGDAPRV